MASNSRCNWTTEDLQAAVSAVRNDKFSLRRAESVYGVPKMLSTYMGKMKLVLNQDLSLSHLLQKRQNWLST